MDAILAPERDMKGSLEICVCVCVWVGVTGGALASKAGQCLHTARHNHEGDLVEVRYVNM